MDQKFVALYEKLKLKLYSYVLYKVRNSTIAEDVVSETFLRFFKEAKENADIFSYGQAWIYRTAYNLIIDHMRSAHYKKGNVISELEAKKSTKSDDESVEFDITDTQIQSFLDNEIKDEQIANIHKNLEDLKPIEREIVELRIFQELPFNEISVVLKIAEGAAKMRFKRALDKLKFIVKSGVKIDHSGSHLVDKKKDVSKEA